MRALCAVLRNFFLVRKRRMKEPKRLGIILKLYWGSKHLQKLRLRSIFNLPVIKTFLPANPGLVELIDNALICNKLAKPVGISYYNYRKVSREMPNLPDPDLDCPCRLRYAEEYRPDGGCLETGDTNALGDDAVTALLALGPKFRFGETTVEMEALQRALDTFVERLSDACRVDKSQLMPWKTAVIEECKARLNRYQVAEDLTYTNALRKLRGFQDHLVLVPMDKAANNTALICKRLYVYRLRKELRGTGPEETYGDEDRSVQDIIESHREQYVKLNLKLPCEWLPYLYWLPKFHKNPVGARYIAGSGRCTIKTLNKLLGRALRLVSLTAMEQDNKRLTATGVRRYFIVEGYRDVAGFLHGWRREGETRRLDTLDFSTMYTMIDLDDLIKRISSIVVRTIESRPQPKYEWMLRVSLSRMGLPQTAEWVDSKKPVHKPSEQIFTVNGLKQLLAYVVKNTFLANGDFLRQQKKGAPIGADAGPELANLYLFAYESEFIDRLEREDISKARSFHLSFRKIDDLLLVDNPNHELALKNLEDGGIYPKFLVRSSTSLSKSHVHFCGMNIRSTDDGDGFEFSVYDKRDDFPFQVHNYLHVNSAVPSHSISAVFTGQLHRFYFICNKGSFFLEAALKVAKYLLRHRGFMRRRLQSLMGTFLSKFVTKFKEKRQWFVNNFKKGLQWSFDDEWQTIRGAGSLSTHSRPRLDTAPRGPKINLRPKITQRPKIMGRKDGKETNVDSRGHLKIANTKEKTVLAPRRQIVPKAKRDAALALLQRIVPRKTMLSDWLDDVQIANVLHEHWKAYGGNRWCTIKMEYPRPRAYVYKNLLRKKRMGRLWINKTLVMAPMNLGGKHWTILTWLRDDDRGRLVWYFDSYGDPIEERFKSLFVEGAEELVFQQFGKVQFDDYQCGVWVCWWAATLLDWLTPGNFLNFSLDDLVFTDATTEAQIQRNSTVAQEAREEYEKRLCDALARGTLVYTAENKMTNGSTPAAGKKPKVREPLMRGSSMNERRKEPSKLVTHGVKTRKSVHWGGSV